LFHTVLHYCTTIPMVLRNRRSPEEEEEPSLPTEQSNKHHEVMQDKARRGGRAFHVILGMVLGGIIFTLLNNRVENQPPNHNAASTGDALLSKKTKHVVVEEAYTESVTTKYCRDSVPEANAFEIIMESMMGVIFREKGLLPPGNVLDVGAQFGEQACHYAVLAPSRTVYALDPSPKNIEQIRKRFENKLKNLVIINKGIGKEAGAMKAPDRYFNMKVGAEFEIVTIDSIFYDRGEDLAFAHIDVEGLELETLKGGQKTIKKSNPFFTVEVRVHQNHTYTKGLIDFIYQLGYDCYMIDEVCGFPHMDFRNILAVPRHRSIDIIYSDAVNLLMASNSIVRVDSNTIFDWVYPCCKLGGECCPGDDPDDSSCCHEDTVLKWLETHNIRKPVQLSSFKHSRKATLRQWYRMRQRGKLTYEEAIVGANSVDVPVFS
jgi:FkbM family methyltransferase